jgi:hypothetical protein
MSGTEATTEMNSASQGKATSAQDVQNQRQPTAADAARANQVAPAAGPTKALTTLEHARELDHAGKESEYMTTVQQAKHQMGMKVQ